MHLSPKIISLVCLVALVVGFSLFYAVPGASACSRMLSAANGQAVLTARNMDWPVDAGTSLWVLPRGIQRDGMAGKNSVKWTSKYASIVTASAWLPSGKSAVSDGMNEKGLVANMLWLDPSDYGKRDEKIPGLSLALWGQYILDNFETVAEAVKALESSTVQIVGQAIPVTVPGAGTTMSAAVLHLSLTDKSGDSAIVEYINGKQVVNHDRKYTIMTNQPSFDEQQENLRQYQGFGGAKPLPGTTEPADRFVRAASQPFRVSGDPKHPYAGATIWTSIADSSFGSYYLAMAVSPFIIWANFADFNLEPGAPAMKLDLRNNPDYHGNAAKQFVTADVNELIPD